jgi:hypothetical protein
LKAGRCSGVRGARWTFGGSGRREKRDGREDCTGGFEGAEGWVVGFSVVDVSVEGISVDSASIAGGAGVVTRETLAGVWGAEGRGLFFERGRDGACRKSSGMSFQLSIVRGLRVVGVAVPFVAIRGGAEMDFGGGGGRRGGAAAAGGGFGGGASCLPVLGFLSQLLREDCNMAGMWWWRWWEREW